MGHPHFERGEISRRGKELYEREIRAKVETEENIGKIVSIDIETGHYAIDADLLKSGQPLLDENPGAAIYGIRIGYNAVFALGGTLVRTTG